MGRSFPSFRAWYSTRARDAASSAGRTANSVPRCNVIGFAENNKQGIVCRCTPNVDEPKFRAPLSAASLASHVKCTSTRFRPTFRPAITWQPFEARRFSDSFRRNVRIGIRFALDSARNLERISRSVPPRFARFLYTLPPSRRYPTGHGNFGKCIGSIKVKRRTPRAVDAWMRSARHRGLIIPLRTARIAITLTLGTRLDAILRVLASARLRERWPLSKGFSAFHRFSQRSFLCLFRRNDGITGMMRISFPGSISREAQSLIYLDDRDSRGIF